MERLDSFLCLPAHNAAEYWVQNKRLSKGPREQIRHNVPVILPRVFLRHFASLVDVCRCRAVRLELTANTTRERNIALLDFLSNDKCWLKWRLRHCCIEHCTRFVEVMMGTNPRRPEKKTTPSTALGFSKYWREHIARHPKKKTTPKTALCLSRYWRGQIPGDRRRTTPSTALGLSK